MNEEKSLDGAICGGNHGYIETKKQWKEHIEWDFKNEFPCMDCWCEIPPTFLRKMKKKDKKEEIK